MSWYYSNVHDHARELAKHLEAFLKDLERGHTYGGSDSAEEDARHTEEARARHQARESSSGESYHPSDHEECPGQDEPNQEMDDEHRQHDESCHEEHVDCWRGDADRECRPCPPPCPPPYPPAPCPQPHPPCPPHYPDECRPAPWPPRPPQPCGTQVIVDGTVCIPPQKPGAETVLRFAPKCRITNWQAIYPQGRRKIVVSGIVTVDVEYVADLPGQPMHFVHFVLPFHTFFHCEHPIMDVKCRVEYVHEELLDPRTISKVIVLDVKGIPC